MNIKQAAEQSGVSARNIRYYQPLRFLISCRMDFIKLLAALISRFRLPMFV